jgi:hypothetical protein
MPAWHNVLSPVQRRFRQKRAERIARLFPDQVHGRVLDLGGSLHFWETVEGILKPSEVVILNITHDGASLGDEAARQLSERSKIVLYDGKTIPYPDKAFDLVICNSVIEHVPPELRHSLAQEIARVGKAFVIQTPAFEFPIEPHFIAPFIHWLPRPLGRALAWITPYGLIGARGHRHHIPVYFNEVRLLSAKETRALFPGAKLHVEWFAGLPKSYLLTMPS